MNVTSTDSSGFVSVYLNPNQYSANSITPTSEKSENFSSEPVEIHISDYTKRLVISANFAAAQAAIQFNTLNENNVIYGKEIIKNWDKNMPSDEEIDDIMKEIKEV
jgi:hypothetical protein